MPEHTLPAKALAYAMGADYLEQDIVATKDDELIVIHDAILNFTTDVAEKFPDRVREDGLYYARDLVMDEIRQLDVHERTDRDGKPVYPDRYPIDGDTFEIHTLGEELTFIAHLQESVGRPVGIYPEIKHPALHRQSGVDISVKVLETLQAHGFDSREDSAYLQCFDDQELIRIRNELGCELKLVQLIGDNSWGESRTDYDELRSKAGLERVA
ncbi:MAG: glycerophosphodiester phosphodiesterase, partial [Pseudomonadota bacterium]